MPNADEQVEAGPPARPRRAWETTAVAALVTLAAVAACNKVWNYDVFWHLRAGRWMLDHGRVLRTDPFAVPDPGAPPGEWVNVHWGFQLLAAGIHRLGGFAGLVALKMAVFAGVLAVLSVWLRRRVGPACLMGVGLWVILAAEQRIRVRPEIFTLLFLAGTIVLIESVRAGASPRRLWWLVPVQLAWVNMHGLHVLGLLLSWTAVGGAFLDRALGRSVAGRLAGAKAVLPVIAATGACLVSPWPIAAAAHPLLLLQRLLGSGRMYSFGVQELCPTWRVNPLANTQLLLAAVLALALLEVLRMRRKAVPLAHAAWFVLFGALGLTAIRNVVFFVLPAGFLLALHGGGWIRAELSRRRRVWRKLSAPAGGVALAAVLAAAAGFATEALFRFQKRPENRFGFGLAEGVHPIGLARWVAACPGEGDVLAVAWGQGSSFLWYAPGRKVWMDGRLEVHSAARFEGMYEIRTKMLSPRQAGDAAEMPLPPSVRFVVVPSDDPRRMKALSACPRRFQPVYVDLAGVCFLRRCLPGEQVTWEAPVPMPAGNLPALDGRLPARPDATLLGGARRRRWFRRNVPAAHFRLGSTLFTLGMNEPAIRHLTVAERLGLTGLVPRVRMLAQAHQRHSRYRPIEPEGNLPVDPNLARALALYAKVDLSDLREKERQDLALLRIHALVAARQIDAAHRAMREYLPALGIPRKWAPGEEIVKLRDEIARAFHLAETTAGKLDLTGLPPADRARVFLRKDLGLIDRALAELAGAGALPRRGRLLLGDLRLRKGSPAAARAEYAKAPDGGEGDVQMRLGLCDWAEGNFPAAIKHLQAAADAATKRAEPALYLGLLHEQLGDYAAAAEAIRRPPTPADSPGGQCGRLVSRLRARLKVRGYGESAPAPTHPAAGP